MQTLSGLERSGRTCSLAGLASAQKTSREERSLSLAGLSCEMGEDGCAVGSEGRLSLNLGPTKVEAPAVEENSASRTHPESYSSDI